MTDHQFNAFLRMLLAVIRSIQDEPDPEQARNRLAGLIKDLQDTLAEPCAPPDGDSDGMTNAQFRGVLLDERANWRDMLELSREDGADRCAEKAEQRINTLNRQLEIL